MHAIYLCENSMSHFEQSYVRNDSTFLHKINTGAVSNKKPNEKPRLQEKFPLIYIGE